MSIVSNAEGTTCSPYGLYHRLKRMKSSFVSK